MWNKTNHIERRIKNFYLDNDGKQFRCQFLNKVNNKTF